jgi:hypothetical protein
MQSAIQKNSRKVTGKRASAAVGAMHAGRQPDDQQMRSVVAKGRHRTRVIPGVGNANLIEECGEARTVAAAR